MHGFAHSVSLEVNAPLYHNNTHKDICIHYIYTLYRTHGTGLVLFLTISELQYSCVHGGGHSVIKVNNNNIPVVTVNPQTYYIY